MTPVSGSSRRIRDVASLIRSMQLGCNPGNQVRRPETGGRRELVYEPETGLPATTLDHQVLAARMGGRKLETSRGSCLVIERCYETADQHAVLKTVDTAVFDKSSLQVLLRGARGHRRRDNGTVLPPEASSINVQSLAFVDLETTGLSGGAGTVAFLVGCGYFSGDRFHICQFFLPAFSAEHALLDAVAGFLAAFPLLVTYNGKTFDLPVMEMRWQFHRMETDLFEKMHLDMLHPARRLWRHRGGCASSGRNEVEGACSLQALERDLLDLRRRGDVDGSEIPSRYFRYIRAGDVDGLAPVLEHNRLDLLSLAGLTVLALRLVVGGAAATRNARECLALGRLYEQSGQFDRATTCFARAAGVCGHEPFSQWTSPLSDVDEPGEVTPEALRRLALLLRRNGRHADAAATWQRLLALADRPRPLEYEAAEALAVYHEHRARDVLAAHAFAVRAFGDNDPTRRRSIEHRLARLERKIAVHRNSGANVPPLV